MKLARRSVYGLCLSMLIACGEDRAPETPVPAASLGDAELVLYTSLPHASVVTVMDAWREASGVTVSFLIDDPAVLIDKMADKAHYPGADLLLLSNSVAIAEAVERDVLRPADVAASASVRSDLPADEDGYWYAVGVTADLIVRNASITPPATYAELGDVRYKGELCLRRGIDPRSVSLVASMTERLGARDAELAVRGWRFNLATAAFDTEAELLAALIGGDCSISIVDSRSVAAIEDWPAHLIAGPPTDAAAGVHGHPVAIGVSRHARDPQAARDFIDWLLTPDGQSALSAADAAPGEASPPETLRDTLPYFLYEDAVQLIERARYR